MMMQELTERPAPITATASHAIEATAETAPAAPHHSEAESREAGGHSLEATASDTARILGGAAEGTARVLDGVAKIAEGAIEIAGVSLRRRIIHAAVASRRASAAQAANAGRISPVAGAAPGREAGTCQAPWRKRGQDRAGLAARKRRGQEPRPWRRGFALAATGQGQPRCGRRAALRRSGTVTTRRRASPFSANLPPLKLPRHDATR